MTSLSMLTLTGNRIAHVGSNFTSETSSLRYIYLGDNEIAQLEPGTMKQFSHAEVQQYIQLGL
jgi:Leucine-rich repeat (LRR) protein